MKKDENKDDFSEIRNMIDYSREHLKKIIEIYLDKEGISPEEMANRFPKEQGVTSRNIRYILDGSNKRVDDETIMRILRLAGLKLKIEDDTNVILKYFK